MDFKLLLDNKILTEEQIRYFKDSNLIIKKRKKFTFDNLDFKKSIETLTEKIMATFIENLNVDASLYEKLIHSQNENTLKAMENSKKEINYILETFLETVSDYVPSFKREWSGTVLNKKTIEAIKKRKLLEVVYVKKGRLLIVDCNLFLNKKTAEAFCYSLNGGKKRGKYQIVKRGIK